MMTMLRFIYGLVYTAEDEEDYNRKSLVHHALVYIVAEKYRLPSLRTAAHDALLSVLLGENAKEDLLEALRIIFIGTPHTDRGARPLLVKYCVSQLSSLTKRADFIVLLTDLAELGAAILRHRDLIPAVWSCATGNKCRGLPSCNSCDEFFKEIPKTRGTVYWKCEGCLYICRPMCSDCSKRLECV